MPGLSSTSGTGPPELLGWSQGAAIAQEVALARPDLVAAGALTATYGRQNTCDRLVREAWAALDGGDEALEPVRLALLLLTGYPPQALGEDSFVAAVVEGARQWFTEAERVPEARRRSGAFICAYQDRLSALVSITVPCLVMGFALEPTPSLPGRGRSPRPSQTAATKSCQTPATRRRPPDAGHQPRTGDRPRLEVPRRRGQPMSALGVTAGPVPLDDPSAIGTGVTAMSGHALPSGAHSAKA